MLTKEEFNEVFNIYGLSKDEYIGIRPIKSGHINNTYTLYFDKGNRVKRYLLQEININVFKNPEELMANIEKVTVFCHDKLKSKKVVNYKNKFLRIFKTKDGKAYFVSSRNHYYRLFHFVENASSYVNPVSLRILSITRLLGLVLPVNVLYNVAYVMPVRDANWYVLIRLHLR